jgi:hypothetical protein
MSTDYDATIELLASGLWALQDRRSRELRAHWHAEFHRAVKLRGGVVGDCFVNSIAKDVFAEVVQRATRLLVNGLTPRLRKRMAESDVERVEVEMSNALRKVLDHIAAGLR